MTDAFMSTSNQNADDRSPSAASQATKVVAGAAGAATTCVLVNCRAGSVIDRQPHEIEASLQQIFAREGHDAVVRCVGPTEIGDEVARVIASSVDTLVVGGGDGTIRSAAAAILEAGAADRLRLGILPLGTLNRLARDLDIPLVPEDAALAIARGDTTEIDVGVVNGRIFLCNSLLGLPLDVAEERQRLRGQPFLERCRRYFALVGQMLGSTRRMTIEIDSGRETRRVRAISVAVANNGYVEQPSLMLKRGALDGGRLTIYIARHRSGLGMLFAVLRAMLGRWRSDPEVDVVEASRVSLKVGGQRIKVSNDGEVDHLVTPLIYENRARALRIVIPTRVT